MPMIANNGIGASHTVIAATAAPNPVNDTARIMPGRPERSASRPPTGPIMTVNQVAMLTTAPASVWE